MLALSTPAAALSEAVPEPSDYRMDAFRAPVPATLEGATVIGTEGAFALWRAGVAFIDVMPKNEKPPNLPEDTLWIDPKRVSIPGASWVPNVGYGRIHQDRDAYFRAALDAAVDGERDAPVVVFCQEDCWMSWNAARRAILDYGYTRVFWYPDGSDGWKAGGHPVEQIPTFEAK
ncbi:MAG: PQQ-dependent catabolism-associated CXXCW motif protein [Pseudomonadota bacterium]